MEFLRAVCWGVKKEAQSHVDVIIRIGYDAEDFAVRGHKLILMITTPSEMELIRALCCGAKKKHGAISGQCYHYRREE